MMACQKPMSCPVNRNPPHPPSSIRSSISTPLSGTKWKKNLARLSRRWNPGSRHASPLSGTAAAAATEKLIRRPKATIQTEDLTASQFASMAGIKIKRGRNHQDTDTSSQHMGLGEYEETDDDDDDTEDDDDDYSNDDSDSDTNTHGMLALSLNHRQLRQLTTKVTKTNPGSVPCMTSYSSLSTATTTTSISATRCHPIWDTRFWQHQQHQKQQQQQQQQQSSSSTKHESKQKQQKDSSGDSKQQQIRPLGQEKSNPPPPPPPGCSSLSSTGRYSDLSANDTLSSGSSTLDTCLSASLPSAKPRVLHKGRFQIVLGEDDTAKQPTEPLVRTLSSDSNNNVVEWHRKRAMTQ